MLTIRGKGHVDYQGKGPFCLSEERAMLPVRGKGRVACQEVVNLVRIVIHESLYLAPITVGGEISLRNNYP